MCLRAGCPSDPYYLSLLHGLAEITQDTGTGLVEYCGGAQSAEPPVHRPADGVALGRQRR